MTIRLKNSPISYIGENRPQGSYVLGIEVLERHTMAFGRFKSGKLVDVLPGNYAYTGSAMAMQGSTCLSRRLLRHASRSDGCPPHPIRKSMLAEFPQVGLAKLDVQAPRKKTLRWNVDHLLDLPFAHLASVYVVRSALSLESAIADMLEGDSTTVVFEKGLGARDRPGHTHLLRANARNTWWTGLTERLDALRIDAERMAT